MKRMMDAIEIAYIKLKKTLSPFGIYVVCSIPFCLLYFYAKDNILIEENMVILGLSVLAALTCFVKTALRVLPTAALLFFSLWDKNVYLAGMAGFLILISTNDAFDGKRGICIYPLLLLILTGYYTKSIILLMTAYMLACSTYWDGSRYYDLVIPMAVVLNMYTFASGTDIETVDLSPMFEERLPIVSYFMKVYEKLIGNNQFEIIKSLSISQWLFYLVLFLALWFGASFFNKVSPGLRNKLRQFEFVLISHIYGALVFIAAHAASLICARRPADLIGYAFLFAKALIISTVISVFVEQKPVVKKDKNLGHDVFISYSHKDIDTVKELCEYLEAEGIGCWYAPRDIVPGKEWASSIMEAIQNAKVMALIFTDHSNASVQVKREVDNAISNGVTVIPIKLTPRNPSEGMEYYLSTLHWLNACNRSIESVSKDLIKMVEKTLNDKNS